MNAYFKSAIVYYSIHIDRKYISTFPFMIFPIRWTGHKYQNVSNDTDKQAARAQSHVHIVNIYYTNSGAPIVE